jgi:hypothetical protein
MAAGRSHFKSYFHSGCGWEYNPARWYEANPGQRSRNVFPNGFAGAGRAAQTV